MATLNEKPGEAGIGGVLRNSSGDLLCISSCHICIGEPNMAELNAIAKALKIPVSEMGVNGSAVCVRVCRIRLH
jgi:ribonuclease HI